MGAARLARPLCLFARGRSVGMLAETFPSLFGPNSKPLASTSTLSVLEAKSTTASAGASSPRTPWGSWIVWLLGLRQYNVSRFRPPLPLRVLPFHIQGLLRIWAWQGESSRTFRHDLDNLSLGHNGGHKLGSLGLSLRSLDELPLLLLRLP